MNTQTEQSHQALRNILLNGRILLNGVPLTANEVGSVIQGEQMLFAKAMQLDKTQELADSQKEPKEPKEPNVLPIRKDLKKEK